jgi:small subunit ribosomal protein S17
MKPRGLRRTRVGVVVGEKMDRSRIVEVVRLVQHPMFKKYVRKRSRFMAHDENNQFHVGDVVRIVESRPLSRRKRWRIREKVS